MLSEFSITLGVVGIVLLSIVGCFSICCFCCAVPICLLISRLFSKSKSVGNSDYQMINLSGDNYNYKISPATVAAEPIAEAYLVPPLAAIHTENSDIVHGIEINPSAPQQQVTYNKEKEGTFRDVWAAVLFVMNVLFVIWFAVQAYFVASESAESSTTVADSSLALMNVLSVSCAVLAVFSALLGSLWLSFLMNHAERLIEFVMWVNIGLLVLSTVSCLAMGQLVGGIIFGLLAGLNYWYYLSVRNRIPFASAVIRTACAALRANYTALLATAYGMLLVQTVWFMLWGAASFGVYQLLNRNTAGGENSSKGGSESQAGGDNQPLNWATFALLVSLYWGAQVIKGVVQTTVCGTVACWWFQPDRAAAVRGSLFRAVTTSFGSICFGALIVALVQALKEFLHMVRDQAQRRRGRDRNLALECLVGVAEYLLNWVEAALNYFNKYAYCYVAAYGLDFITSGKQVTGLFQRRGWSAIINDSLVARTILMGMLSLALFSGLTGALMSQALVGSTYAAGMNASALAAVGGLAGGLMGVAVGMILTNALESAVAMVFVSFAEDPTALETNHPAEFENLLSKWRLAYPETVQWVCSSNYNGFNGGVGSSAVVAQAVPLVHNSSPMDYLPNHASNNKQQHQYNSPLYHGVVATGGRINNPPPMNPNYSRL